MVYIIQWKDFDNKWMDYTSHYFFFKAKKKLFKHCSRGTLAPCWRIVNSDDDRDLFVEAFMTGKHPQTKAAHRCLGIKVVEGSTYDERLAIRSHVKSIRRKLSKRERTEFFGGRRR